MLKNKNFQILLSLIIFTICAFVLLNLYFEWVTPQKVILIPVLIMFGFNIFLAVLEYRNPLMENRKKKNVKRIIINSVLFVLTVALYVLVFIAAAVREAGM